ncbi:hypothetical protein ACT3HK_14720 [Thermolongibacillus altinsuensis]
MLAFLNKPVPDMEFADFVELMEKITYQNWVRRLGKTKRNTVYYQVINLINKGYSADELIETVKKYADNKEFEDTCGYLPFSCCKSNTPSLGTRKPRSERGKTIPWTNYGGAHPSAKAKR